MKRENFEPSNESRAGRPASTSGRAKPHWVRNSQGYLMQPIPLGRVRLTRRAADAFMESKAGIWPFLTRHSLGDWGEVSEADKQENDLSVEEGWRLLSAYHLPNTDVKFWVITEADRSATTLLLPDEY